MKYKILSLVLMVTAYILPIRIFSLQVLELSQSKIIGSLITGLLTVGIFYAIHEVVKAIRDRYEPQLLSIGDVKGLLLSRTFWVAVVALVNVILLEFTSIQIESTIVDSIFNVDWSNISLGLMTILVIVFQQFDPRKRIS